MGGIKETIIYEVNKKFILMTLQMLVKNGAMQLQKILFLTFMPRNILEFFCVFYYFNFIVLMVFNNETNFNSALPSIAIYILRNFYKLLPIFQGIYQGFII